jgi:hypothetical protein
MKIPIVKEYGSWAVFIFSCSAGITTGFLTRPWQSGRDVSLSTLLTVLGLTLLINAKNPLTSAVRAKGKRTEDLLWFALFIVTGLAFLVPFLSEGLTKIIIFLPLVVSYVILLSRGKEHSLLTELNGFSLLTLSAPILYFVISGELSLRLYGAVFIFFAAGVFKVRAQLKRTATFRWAMVFYCLGSLIAFSRLLHIPALVLLPLVENIISVVKMREEKLSTTGNIELIKGLIFTVLLGLFWQ